MSILILATSGSRGEIALARPRAALEVLPLAAGAARGRMVMPTVRALLETSGPTGIEGIVVDIGPGSFTGVRVGVTTAKTLAYALDVPVVGVMSLRALAERADPGAAVVAVRDAGRGRLYYAHYGPARGGERPLRGAPGRALAADVARWADGALLLDGEAGAAELLAVGRPALEQDRATQPHDLAPLYLQASAPERRRAGEKDDAAPAPPPANRP